MVHEVIEGRFNSPFIFDIGEHVVGFDVKTGNEHVYEITARNMMGILHYYDVRVVDKQYDVI